MNRHDRRSAGGDGGAGQECDQFPNESGRRERVAVNVLPSAKSGRLFIDNQVKIDLSLIKVSRKTVLPKLMQKLNSSLEENSYNSLKIFPNSPLFFRSPDSWITT